MEKPRPESSPEGLLPRRKDPPPAPALHSTEPISDERSERFREPETRNFLLSLFVLGLFVLTFVAALFLAGPQAPVIGAGSSFVSVLIVWTLWRMDLHRQPNGFLLSFAIAAFVTMFVPLAAGLVMFLNEQQEQRWPSLDLATEPTPSAAPAVPKLSDKFEIERPDVSSEDYVRVIRESRVTIDGESYLIAVGEEFPLYRVAENEVIFRAKDFLISLPPDVIRVFRAPKAADTGTQHEEPETDTTPTPPPSPADGLSPLERIQVTRKAQAEATKRYPALAVKDTPENTMFLETYKRLKESGSDLLKDPEWPLQIAEALAEREGWTRNDIAPTPTPPQAIPVQPSVTAESPDDASGFPPFEPTPPPPLHSMGEELPLPQ